MQPLRIRLASLVWVAVAVAARSEPAVRRLPVQEYRDRMRAGWIGQMAGVAWGAPTEFKRRGRILPADKAPRWQPERINSAFGQDDLYVEMTFLRTLEVHGWDVSQAQAGIDFANSSYRLWHANRAGRDNLRKGIAPPDSGHPQFNRHADDIDYQIEADFSGLIAPGLPNTVIALGDKFGHLMNYGDGVYGGQFIGGMYAEAFFESEPRRLVAAGLRCIPANSLYARVIRQVLQWHQESPNDWQSAWQRVEEAFHRAPDIAHGLCSRPGGEGAFDIDAKLNGAYVALGLLYGNGDPDRTALIAMRCGQDSDCNPASALGVLATALGMARLPVRFHQALQPNRRFAFTSYTFNQLLDVCEQLARQAVLRAGGRLERDRQGDEVFVLPRQVPAPLALEQSSHPGPIAGSRFSPTQRAQIRSSTDARQ